jgi:phytoene dehydrogenase-like protein
VDYVDQGWGALVAAAADLARSAGVQIRKGAPAVCAAARGQGWMLATESARVRCSALLLATGPNAARSIVPSEMLARVAAAAIPARVACLDVALASLPNPSVTFALGVDRPIYFSLHSRAARVAPRGCALVSTMKYLPAGSTSDPARDLGELEALLEQLQPGWRALQAHRQWLPSMVATNALVTAADSGVRGRPPSRVGDAPGVWVAGDWVGDEGMLLDAALASAERAADEISIALSRARVA